MTGKPLLSVCVVIVGEDNSQSILGVFESCDAAMAEYAGPWVAAGALGTWYHERRPLRIEEHPLRVMVGTSAA